MRYVIEAVQYGARGWVEICRVANNPEAIVEGLQNKRLRIKLSDGRWGSTEKYTGVRVVDIGDD